MKCFFCDTVSGEMHQASSMTLDGNIRTCATDMCKSRIIAKLSEGDKVSREAWYHNSCLTMDSNKYRSFCKAKIKERNGKKVNCKPLHYVGYRLTVLTSLLLSCQM